MSINVTLNDKEIRVLLRYSNHLWQTARISLRTREILNRVIMELDEELNIIERDLKAEKK